MTWPAMGGHLLAARCFGPEKESLRKKQSWKPHVTESAHNVERLHSLVQ